MFWEDNDISWDWEESSHESTSDWNEYIVVMHLVDKYNPDPISLNVWTTGLEEAMTCGEVLSAIYFNG